MNLWPPFSVTMNTQPSGVTTTPNASTNFPTGIFPVYYIPQRTAMPGEYHNPNLTPRYPVQYVPGMMYNYNTIFPASPIFCSPVPMVPIPLPQNLAPVQQEQNHHTTQVNNPLPPEHKPSPSVTQFQRPASQATSVKAEPGSAMGSIASANKVSFCR